MFRGFVRQVKAEYPPQAGNARVTVECQDDSLQLDRTHRRKAWATEQLPTSDQQILMEVLSEYAPLSLDAESGPGQSGITNLNHLSMSALQYRSMQRCASPTRVSHGGGVNSERIA